MSLGLYLDVLRLSGRQTDTRASVSSWIRRLESARESGHEHAARRVARRALGCSSVRWWRASGRADPSVNTHSRFEAERAPSLPRLRDSASRTRCAAPGTEVDTARRVMEPAPGVAGPGALRPDDACLLEPRCIDNTTQNAPDKKSVTCRWLAESCVGPFGAEWLHAS